MIVTWYEQASKPPFLGHTGKGKQMYGRCCAVRMVHYTTCSVRCPSTRWMNAAILLGKAQTR